MPRSRDISGHYRRSGAAPPPPISRGLCCQLQLGAGRPSSGASQVELCHSCGSVGGNTAARSGAASFEPEE
eukprot:scaffold98301_cov36-Tisochrysis_lutea.AAC.2